MSAEEWDAIVSVRDYLMKMLDEKELDNIQGAITDAELLFWLGTARRYWEYVERVKKQCKD